MKKSQFSQLGIQEGTTMCEHHTRESTFISGVITMIVLFTQGWSIPASSSSMQMYITHMASLRTAAIVPHAPQSLLTDSKYKQSLPN